MAVPEQPIGTNKTTLTLTVSTAATGLSDIGALGGHTINSIQMSTVGWTNGNLTFMASLDSTSQMASVRHTTAGTELTYVTTTDHQLLVDPYLFSGIRYIQLRSGTTTTPVAQAAERTVVLGLTPIAPYK